ncbi:unnamed protein product, partial [Staurois parvus]
MGPPTDPGPSGSAQVSKWPLYTTNHPRKVGMMVERPYWTLIGTDTTLDLSQK